MPARDIDYRIASTIERRTGRTIGISQANTLRRAEMTLHRWAERECGDVNGFWIERDEVTGKTYSCTSGDSRRYRIPDLERDALKRVAKLCNEIGLYFYHQTDPRGCALYVAAEPLNDANYSSSGVAVC